MSARWLRAGISTIRDCRIRTIYLLPDTPGLTAAEESGSTTTQEPQ